jgi:hypothetical protein
MLAPFALAIGGGAILRGWHPKAASRAYHRTITQTVLMNILGISCYFHDAAAALLGDGQLVATKSSSLPVLLRTIRELL